MNNLKFLCMGLLVIYLLQFTIVHSQAVALIAAPPGGPGYPFTTKCIYPRVFGFNFSAYCKDINGYFHFNRLNFSNCVFNYIGRLTTFKQNRNELFTRNCFTYRNNLVCLCQQPTTGPYRIFRQCAIPLNFVFFADNVGRLSC